MSEASAHSIAVRPADETQPLEPDKSLSELLGRLSTDFGQLVTTQVELAKVEIKEEVAKAGKGAGMLGGAAVTGLLSVLLLSFAAAWGLAAVMPTGWAFLIVAAVWGAVAGVLFMMGRKNLTTVEPVPQTQQTVKEDIQWAKQQMS